MKSPNMAKKDEGEFDVPTPIEDEKPMSFFEFIRTVQKESAIAKAENCCNDSGESEDER
jgi:hypothetical protein